MGGPWLCSLWKEQLVLRWLEARAQLKVDGQGSNVGWVSTHPTKFHFFFGGNEGPKR